MNTANIETQENRVTATLMTYGNFLEARKTITLKEKIAIGWAHKGKLLSLLNLILFAFSGFLLSIPIVKIVTGGFTFLSMEHLLTSAIWFSIAVSIYFVIRIQRITLISISRFKKYMESLSAQRNIIQAHDDEHTSYDSCGYGVIYQVYADRANCFTLISQVKEGLSEDLPSTFMVNGFEITLFNIQVHGTSNVYYRDSDGKIDGETIKERYNTPIKMTYHHLVSMTYSLSLPRLERLIFNEVFTNQERTVFNILIRNKQLVNNIFFIRSITMDEY